MASSILPLFAYGTLAERATLERLLGAKPGLTLSTAELPEYEKVWIPTYGYPFVVQRRGRRVVGVLVDGLVSGDWVKLDRYEGLAEGNYRRMRVRVRLLEADRDEQVDAYVYTLGPRWEDFGV
jgi:gamma-glutamylcyclotransferase (GGCT)/AIG2-like uncharacterized protein YtfP